MWVQHHNMEEIDDRDLILIGFSYFSYKANAGPNGIDDLDLSFLNKDRYYIYYDNVTNDIIKCHELGNNE